MLSEEATRGNDAGANSTSTRYGLSPPGRTPVSQAQENFERHSAANKQANLFGVPAREPGLRLVRAGRGAATHQPVRRGLWLVYRIREVGFEAKPMPAEFA